MFLSFHFYPYTFHFFFSFFFFLFFSSAQESNLIPPSFIFFFTSRTFQQPHQLLHIAEKREREREREVKDWYSSATPPLMEIEVAERTKPVEISVHHAALPRPPPHLRLSSSPPPRRNFFLPILAHFTLFYIT